MRGLVAALTLAATAASAEDLKIFPQEIEKRCFGGRAEMYDECGSQLAVLRDARAAAAGSGRTVLVIYGAEWCIWCHVLKRHLEGRHGAFSYTLEGESGYNVNEHSDGNDAAEAAILAEFASRAFVVAAIESQHTMDGDLVLSRTGAADHVRDWIPFVFTLDADGRFAAKLPEFDELPDLEVRREGDDWYRGYDRAVLMRELGRMLEAAR